MHVSKVQCIQNRPNNIFFSRTSPFYCFRLFPILLGTIVGIVVCVIFTVTDTFPEDDASRTDNDRAAQGIAEAPWIFFPYPCKSTINDVTSYDVTDVDVDSLVIQVNGVYHNSLHQPLSV